MLLSRKSWVLKANGQSMQPEIKYRGGKRLPTSMSSQPLWVDHHHLIWSSAMSSSSNHTILELWHSLLWQLGHHNNTRRREHGPGSRPLQEDRLLLFVPIQRQVLCLPHGHEWSAWQWEIRDLVWAPCDKGWRKFSMFNNQQRALESDAWLRQRLWRDRTIHFPHWLVV